MIARALQFIAIILIGFGPVLLIWILCVLAIKRYLPTMSKARLIYRTFIFLAGIKLTAIWGPVVLGGISPVLGGVAQLFFSSVLVPELQLANHFLNVPTSAAYVNLLLLTGMSLVSSGLLASVMVYGIAALNRNKLALLVIFGTVSLSLGSVDAYSQSGQTITLPTKTVKILPTSDVTIVAAVRGDLITLPSGDNSLLDAALNTSFVTCNGLLGTWATTGIASLIDTDIDRQYANAFLVKYSANNPPPNTINPDTVEQGGDFRLFNRMQTAFRVSNGQVLNAPKFLQAKFDVGLSPNPCSRFLTTPILNSGEVNVSNGGKGPSASATGVFQLNEGRLGTLGQEVNLTLNGHSTPWIWSVIEFDTHGQLILPANTQIFPTYFIYQDGQLVNVINQSDIETFISLDETSQQGTPVP